MIIFNQHQRRDLIADVAAAPQSILEWQEALDMFTTDCQDRLTDLMMSAYTEPLFPGKKEGDPMRPAGNDDERKLAVMLVCQRDKEYQRLVEYREDAARHLAYERNKLESAKIVARLLGENNQ